MTMLNCIIISEVISPFYLKNSITFSALHSLSFVTHFHKTIQLPGLLGITANEENVKDSI